MASIEVYTSLFCGYCHRAKSLLTKKGQSFEEIDVLLHPSRRTEMVARAGGHRTVPQIFIDGRHIGGCRELHGLEKAGELDRLLAGST